MTYRNRTNDFYSQVMLKLEPYARPYPNTEEATRVAVILKFMSVLRQYHLPSSARIRLLDVGCGRGWLTNMLSIFGEVEGIDPSEGSLQFACANFPNVAFHAGFLSDVICTPTFRPYDVIVSSEVIEHVPHTEKQQFVESLAAVLKSGGHCLLSTPRGELWSAYRRKTNWLQPVEDWLTEDQVKALFVCNGFTVMGHDRACPLNVGLAGYILHHPQWGKVFTYRRTRFLGQSLAHLSSIYQIWWLQKRG